MEGLRIPGLSLAIVKNGKVVKKSGYGWANLELKVPASPQTVYEIGSISKSFTAMAIAMLMERGKLNPDDRINSFFSCAPPYWNNITIRQFISFIVHGPDVNPDKILQGQDFSALGSCGFQ